MEKVHETIHKLINSKKFEDNIIKINNSIKAAAEEQVYQIEIYEMTRS